MYTLKTTMDHSALSTVPVRPFLVNPQLLDQLHLVVVSEEDVVVVVEILVVEEAVVDSEVDVEVPVVVVGDLQRDVGMLTMTNKLV